MKTIDKAAWAALLVGVLLLLNRDRVAPGPDVVPGQRTVVILRESADDTPQFGALVNALRVGEPSRYLKEKGHSLTLHDPGDKDQNGQPVPLVTKLAALSPPPSLFVLNGQAVVFKGPLPGSAAEVIDAIKKGGG